MKNSIYTLNKSLILVILITVILTAQDNINYPPILDKKLSVNFSQISFKETLDKLSELSGVKFNYNVNDIPLDFIISDSFKNEKLINILLHVLHTTDTELELTNHSQFVICSAIPDRDNKIFGKITDTDGNPLPGTNIIINYDFGTTSDAEGMYELKNLKLGFYDITYKYIGYEPVFHQKVFIKNGMNLRIDTTLEEKAIELRQITITPGKFTLLNRAPVSLTTLQKEDLPSFNLGEDIFRTVTKLPGISAIPYSARFNVRGGEYDEILVLLDGMELYNPFHLRDFSGGILSACDLSTVQKVDLLKGGFPAIYGHKMSAVFDIHSVEAESDNTFIELGLSIMNTKLTMYGKSDDEYSWLFSMRRGNLDLISKVTDSTDMPDATFYDIRGRLNYKLSQTQNLSFNFLYIGDDLLYSSDENESADNNYNDIYLWSTLESVISDNINVESIASFTLSNKNRNIIANEILFNGLPSSLNDTREFSYLALKQNIFIDLSENILFQGGYHIKTGSSDYLYQRTLRRETINDDGPMRAQDSLNIKLNKTGNRFSTFASLRFLLRKNLVVETGLRYDRTSYSPDRNLSPRIAVSYSPGENTHVKAAWGKYYQQQDLHEIETIDGETGFSPAQLAEHFVVGFEHFFDAGFHLRIDAYLKKLSSQKRDYRNYFTPEDIISETSNDRIVIDYISGEAHGIETLFDYSGDPFDFSLSYTYSIAEDNFLAARIHERALPTTEEKFPRPYDQRHNFMFDVTYSIEESWKFNLSWNYRTGWPYTDAFLVPRENSQGNLDYYFVFDSYNKKRFPDFSQVDLRINKYFHTAFGKINLSLEVINLLGNKNVRVYSFQGNTDRLTGLVYVDKIPRTWLPIIPIMGVSWTTEL